MKKCKNCKYYNGKLICDELWWTDEEKENLNSVIGNPNSARTCMDYKYYISPLQRVAKRYK